MKDIQYHSINLGLRNPELFFLDRILIIIKTLLIDSKQPWIFSYLKFHNDLFKYI